MLITAGIGQKVETAERGVQTESSVGDISLDYFENLEQTLKIL
jgi:hypothetical protein